eukprot:4638621-Pyramimonas_sp.AAC.1
MVHDRDGMVAVMMMRKQKPNSGCGEIRARSRVMHQDYAFERWQKLAARSVAVLASPLALAASWALRAASAAWGFGPLWAPRRRRRNGARRTQALLWST